ncbi:MAG: RNA 2',3'-cyclic phosphodiesterase [Gammaproteobacteria bacterium]|nr:RNA 2',3'-cyclic phosphodiesterase [Gammaproteobacteria bacterium]
MTKSVERLFFALWPDQQVRKSLAEAFAGIAELSGQGRAMNTSNLHMTLHFLGNIPVNQIACYIDRAQQIETASFELEINQLGYFKRPQISWLGSVGVPPALLQLQYLLGTTIKYCGFQPETRPYMPHITMARKIKQAVTVDSINSIPWKVENFVLVQSLGQGESTQYQVKTSFPLKINA